MDATDKIVAAILAAACFRQTGASNADVALNSYEAILRKMEERQLARITAHAPAEEAFEVRTG